MAHAILSELVEMVNSRHVMTDGEVLQLLKQHLVESLSMEKNRIDSIIMSECLM